MLVPLGFQAEVGQIVVLPSRTVRWCRGTLTGSKGRDSALARIVAIAQAFGNLTVDIPDTSRHPLRTRSDKFARGGYAF